MKLVPLPIDGTYVLEAERMEDHRGFFARTWDRAELAAHGLEARVEQASVAFNRRAGTLRGLHFQLPPHEEVKIVRCTRGAVYDVVVDLRPASASYLDWTAVELTADNHRALYIPRGVAHGYQTLTDDAETTYLISEAHAPAASSGVRFDDPAFGISWPLLPPTVISERDAAWPRYEPSRPRTRGT